MRVDNACITGRLATLFSLTSHFYQLQHVDYHSSIVTGLCLAIFYSKIIEPEWHGFGNYRGRIERQDLFLNPTCEHIC